MTEIINSPTPLEEERGSKRFGHLNFEIRICSPREIGVTLLWEKKKEGNQS